MLARANREDRRKYNKTGSNVDFKLQAHLTRVTYVTLRIAISYPLLTNILQCLHPLATEQLKSSGMFERKIFFFGRRETK